MRLPLLSSSLFAFTIFFALFAFLLPSTSYVSELSVTNNSKMASSAASQVILHPAVSASLKVSATTLGRDKVCWHFQPVLAWIE